MKKIFFCLAVCSVMAASAQKSYTLTRDNTDIKFVDGKLAIWDVLISSSRMTFAGGFGAKMYLNGIYLNLNYDFHYLDNLAEASSSENIQGYSIYKPTKSRNGEIMAGYYFQKETEGTIKVHIKSEGKVSYYAKIPAHYNKLFGIQAGYKKGFSHLTIPAGAMVKDYYAPENGAFAAENGMTTFMQYGWISVGPSYGRTVDVEIDVDQYGHRKAQYFERYYANVLIAGKSTLEDVYYTTDFGGSNQMVHQYVLDGNTEMSKIGFNIGFESYKFDRFGFIYGLEAGAMPGVKKGGNGYLQFKWGFIFGKAFGG
jgi:hypothetical protein